MPKEISFESEYFKNLKFISWLAVILIQYCESFNEVIHEKVKDILLNSAFDTITKVEELDENLDDFIKNDSLREECVRLLLKNLDLKGNKSLKSSLIGNVSMEKLHKYQEDLDMEPVGISSLGWWKCLPETQGVEGSKPSSSLGNGSSNSISFKKRPAGTANAVLSAAVAAQEAAAAAAAQMAQSTISATESPNNYTASDHIARVDDLAESALSAHFTELTMQGVPSDSTETLIDPYEQELDVYTTLSPAALVQNLFSHMTPEQIDQVLEAHHYNIEDTMDALFNFDEGAIVDTSTTPPKNPSKQVCRHFLVGQCYRSDCWYSHDPEVVLCKFWLKGRCFKGDHCEFSHGQALEQISSRSKVAQPVVPVKAPPSLEEFPALGGPISLKPTIDFWAPSASYNDALNKSAASMDKYAMAAAQIQAQKRQYLKSLDTDWVETGTNLNNTYLGLRKDAIEVALNRNKLFQKATEAYLSGNKAAARSLSLSAHQLNSQVSQLHAEAAKSIFKKRNPHLSLGGTNTFKDGNAIIDLHGLHPNEGIEILDDALKELVGKKFKGKVIIVTGTGHHSRGRIKVAPAIKQHLIGNGWKPKEASLSDGKGGMFVVHL